MCKPITRHPLVHDCLVPEVCISSRVWCLGFGVNYRESDRGYEAGNKLVLRSRLAGDLHASHDEWLVLLSSGVVVVVPNHRMVNRYLPWEYCRGGYFRSLPVPQWRTLLPFLSKITLDRPSPGVRWYQDS